MTAAKPPTRIDQLPEYPGAHRLLNAANAHDWGVTLTDQHAPVAKAADRKLDGDARFSVRFDCPEDWPDRGGIRRIVATFATFTGRLIGATVFERTELRERRSVTQVSIEGLCSAMDPSPDTWAAMTYVPPPPVVNPSIGIEHHDGALVITIADRGSSAREVLATVTLDPWATIELFRDLSQHVAYTMRDLLGNLTTGACPTCRNIRLVDMEVNGRASNGYCPDCSPRTGKAEQRAAWLATTPPLKALDPIRASYEERPWL